MRYWYKRMPERYGDDLSIDKLEGNKQTEQERISDTDERKRIQTVIRRMKKFGCSEKETLERLYSDFPKSEYKGFFEGWVKNVYKDKKGQKTIRGQIRADIDEGR